MQPTVWQRAGAMLINIDHDGSHKAKLLHDNGFRCVFPQTHVGAISRHSVSAVNTYLKPYRDLGFKIGHWGYLDRTDPIKVAETASSWDDYLHSDFYVPNAEIAYKYTDSLGAHDPIAFGRSTEFCRAYHKLQPTKTVGISSYSIFATTDIHWAAWLNMLNARALPQAYVNEVGPKAAPEFAFKGAIDVKQPWNVMLHPVTLKVIPGFPSSYVHVTIAKPDPTDKYPLTIEDWIAMLVRAKAVGHTVGFSCYEVENFADSDIIKLGNAIKTHKLAVI